MQRRTGAVWMLIVLLAGSLALAGHEVAVLDGSTWKVSVDPDEDAKKKGQKDFKETFTFSDGKVAMSEYGRMGFDSAAYGVTKVGEKDWSFKTEQFSPNEGTCVWTGTVHGNNIEGKLICTKKDGAVLTYSFKGDKAD